LGAKAARKYHQTQAKSVVDSIGRILQRVNSKYTPNWLLLELHNSYHVSQCMLAERERDMRDYGMKSNHSFEEEKKEKKEKKDA